MLPSHCVPARLPRASETALLWWAPKRLGQPSWPFLSFQIDVSCHCPYLFCVVFYSIAPAPNPLDRYRSPSFVIERVLNGT